MAFFNRVFAGARRALAAQLASHGHRVHVRDIDLNNSSTAWRI